MICDFLPALAALMLSFGLSQSASAIQAENCYTQHNIDAKYTRMSLDQSMQDQNYKCFVACSLLNHKVYNDKGDTNWESIKTYYAITDQHKNLLSIQGCIQDNLKTEICDRISETQMCISKYL